MSKIRPTPLETQVDVPAYKPHAPTSYWNDVGELRAKLVRSQERRDELLQVLRGYLLDHSERMGGKDCECALCRHVRSALRPQGDES